MFNFCDEYLFTKGAVVKNHQREIVSGHIKEGERRNVDLFFKGDQCLRNRNPLQQDDSFKF